MYAVVNVNEYVPLGLMTLLVKLGDPVDSTLCWSEPTHVQVTVPPTATVSTAGFCVLFRVLRK
jgi:hypothetical protein